MAGRQIDQLSSLGGEKGVAADQKRAGALACNHCKGRIDLLAGAGVEDLDLQFHSASSRRHISQRGLANGRIARADQHRDSGSCGRQLVQQLGPLCGQFTTDKIHARQIAARSGQAGRPNRARQGLGR